MTKTKKRRRMARRRALAFAVFSAALALILLLLSLGGLILTLHIPDIVKFFGKDYSFRFCTAENRDNVQRRFAYDADFICRDGVLYMDFSVLSELCGFSVSGDGEQRRYLFLNENLDDMLVNVGTTSVVLAGQPLTMDAPAFLSESGSLYLPCDFVENHFDGVQVEQDAVNPYLYRVIYDAASGCQPILHRSENCTEVAPPEDDG